MMVSVVMSRATLVPVTSFSLSTLVLHPTTYLGPLLAFTMTAHNQRVKFCMWLKQNEILHSLEFLPALALDRG